VIVKRLAGLVLFLGVEGWVAVVAI